MTERRTKVRKNDWRVLVLINDYPDGTKQHSYYGRGSKVFNKVSKLIAKEANLEWHFHGGFIRKERKTLIRRLRQADVLICYPGNMNFNDVDMQWDAAEKSMLKIVTDLKTANKDLKIFFLREPNHLIDEFQEFGEFVTDIHDSILFDYFAKH